MTKFVHFISLKVFCIKLQMDMVVFREKILSSMLIHGNMP
nr:MAG TPA: hypothetical protein [Caudoviricetes sp.]